MATFSDKVRSTNSLVVATPVGATGGTAVDSIVITPVANTAAANVMTITNAPLAQASLITIPDPGAATASLVVSSGGSVNTVSVTLNTAAVTGAYAAPALLIPAPGAGKVVVVQEATVVTASTGNTAYATGTSPVIQYDNTVHGAGTSAVASGLVAGDITASASQVRVLTSSAAALTGVTNKGVYFSNATGGFTNGTGTNITITLTYQVIAATV